MTIFRKLKLILHVITKIQRHHQLIFLKLNIFLNRILIELQMTYTG